jgi:hypothetical protein
MPTQVWVTDSHRAIDQANGDLRSADAALHERRELNQIRRAHCGRLLHRVKLNLDSKKTLPR